MCCRRKYAYNDHFNQCRIQFIGGTCIPIPFVNYKTEQTQAHTRRYYGNGFTAYWLLYFQSTQHILMDSYKDCRRFDNILYRSVLNILFHFLPPRSSHMFLYTKHWKMDRQLEKKIQTRLSVFQYLIRAISFTVTFSGISFRSNCHRYHQIHFDFEHLMGI